MFIKLILNVRFYPKKFKFKKEFTFLPYNLYYFSMKRMIYD
ncbi:hypothetical protein ATCC51561_251 [Campylobacter concisus ATCC 51561]|nr:hypothetical protein ATCC51561_251 [Campylobacter concisus ATCC 51561]